jgi:hypothetical protein
MCLEHPILIPSNDSKLWCPPGHQHYSIHPCCRLVGVCCHLLHLRCCPSGTCWCFAGLRCCLPDHWCCLADVLNHFVESQFCPQDLRRHLSPPHCQSLISPGSCHGLLENSHECWVFCLSGSGPYQCSLEASPRQGSTTLLCLWPPFVVVSPLSRQGVLSSLPMFSIMV